MNAEQFFNKVAYMRSLQKQFFASHDPFVLRKSKAVEAEIDREIKRVNEIKARERLDAVSPKLFD